MPSETTPDNNQTPRSDGRPCLVTVTAILLTLVGFSLEVLAIPGILGILNRISKGIYTDPPDTIATIVLMFIGGILAFAGGIGLLRMKRWGRILAIGFIICYLIAEIARLLTCKCYPANQQAFVLFDLILLLVRLIAAVIIVRWYIVNRRRFT